MSSSFEKELGGELLASVSRSFYLSLKPLPHELRGPISLAYLLARTSDTIADSSKAPVAARLTHLGAFLQMLESGPVADETRLLQAEIVPDDPAERALLQKSDRCIAWLADMGADDRADIVEALKKIIRGQELDVARFGDAESVVALDNAEELDEYTYLVAGCVGEFWTRVCFRHVPNYARLTLDKMCELGANFGRGLQLVNILRDLPADLDAGRCYLPADQLAEIGLTPGMIRKSPTPARRIIDRWLDKAGAHLDDAFRYIEAVVPRRLRYACILPWHLGLRTVALLRERSPIETAERIKVSRKEVRSTMRRATFWALSNAMLRGAHRRLSG
jgi:farnesyl-diphosphate farnesyltransferase